jgi:hypothetical protein
MKRAILVMAATSAFACGSNNGVVGSGQFSGPTALAVVPAADRDLVFVAGTGRDGLRALEICEFVDNDGNLGASCPEDLQFVPGPIRVFPANVETFNRPVHLAGVWLTDGPDGGTVDAADGGSRQGAVLAVGADDHVRLVDAKNLLAAANTGQLAAPLGLQVDGTTVDVVADNLYLTGATSFDPAADTLGVAPSVDAFVATLGSNGGPPELMKFTVTLDANGAAVLPPQSSGRCSLGNVNDLSGKPTAFVPSRLALAPRETPPVQDQSTLCKSGVSPASCLPEAPLPTDDIFVANSGAAGGVARVARNSLLPLSQPLTPCTTTRIVDPDGHAVNGIALSPQWYETLALPGAGNPPDAGTTCGVDLACEAVTINHPAGELLMMTLLPNKAAVPDAGQPNLIPDPGGVLFADLCTYTQPVGLGDLPHCAGFDGGTIIPIPPFRYDQLSPGALTGALPPQAMEPISPETGVLQDGTFIRAFRPLTVFGAGQPDFACPDGACTTMYVGSGAAAQVNLFLIAAVTSSDGATYFIDVVHRRFVSTNFYNLPDSLGNSSLEPAIILFPVLSPSSAASPPPKLTELDAQTKNPNNPADTVDFFGLRAGVSHTASWFVAWHDTFPGLDRVGGTVTEAGDGLHYFLDIPPNALDAAIADPVLHFAPGDNVSFATYTPPPTATDPCKAVLNVEGAFFLSFEAEVTAIDGNRLTLFIDPTVQFDPNQDCPVFGAIAEFHTGGNLGQKPWVVHQNDTILARVGQNELYFEQERRFDYPFDYNPTDAFPLPNTPPVKNTDIGLSFTLEGGEPLVPGSRQIFSIQDSRAPVAYSDTAVVSGYATGVVPYSSLTYPNALFTAVTGSDSVLMAVPSVLGGSIIGVRAFR